MKKSILLHSVFSIITTLPLLAAPPSSAPLEEAKEEEIHAQVGHLPAKRAKRSESKSNEPSAAGPAAASASPTHSYSQKLLFDAFEKLDLNNFYGKSKAPEESLSQACILTEGPKAQATESGSFSTRFDEGLKIGHKAKSALEILKKDLGIQAESETIEELCLFIQEKNANWFKRITKYKNIANLRIYCRNDIYLLKEIVKAALIKTASTAA
ncbi:MAG: hypothetical protein CMM87_03510 [Rickettsiales bacterium]|nr:hypothetical protein [Rickettsiales bacterium]